jgi:hypothetical protein
MIYPSKYWSYPLIKPRTPALLRSKTSSMLALQARMAQVSTMSAVMEGYCSAECSGEAFEVLMLAGQKDTYNMHVPNSAIGMSY